MGAQPVAAAERIPCSHRPSKLPPSTYDRIFALTVENDCDDFEDKVFHVYREVLKHSSIWFSKRLEDEWKGDTGSMNLHKYKTPFCSAVDIFELFFYWLNTGELAISTFAAHMVLESLATAYEFSNEYDINEFGNALLDAFYLHLVELGVMIPSTIVAIYKLTEEDSEVRRMSAEWVFENGDTAMSTSRRKKIDRDILWETINMSYEHKQGVGYLKRLTKGQRLDHIQNAKDHLCENFHDHDLESIKTDED
ncbi:BTB domain containing protein [Pyrenophora tritici-repentis]|uniref:BTB domain containing protein n=2 Tax=Pyrenophora tritici-repentis TaxID=45151 RepID=A0A2W1CU58_9PLEO|nr:uncharacterized protein PTRG_04799 [Pyrenophora tritici-repentis Pt-1C-BFP]KAA8612424.1 hypothetical protein PtrV1_12993 [Pyrenophora tritici-repentis]EDU47706.1 predicted protein [Pyrenophora tritici-repentis Pt-1C-BFP]KAF7447049.1 hypothetical protein A1F99_084960 [Pyrenophora tritici-repentis]KAF7569340.1 BTB domain containing protein [Pyrenophora tritici-repentis]KAG9382887.1 hypothetical protein A1F94_006808 [Pyrenophora tritici-repentis]